MTSSDRASGRGSAGFCKLLSGELSQILGENSVHLFTTIAGLRSYLSLSRSGRSRAEDRSEAISSDLLPDGVGFVPTMGALHAGHLSLMQRARQENHLVVVSIFVNPLQFGPQEDFHRYPRTLEHDQALCQQVGVDVIFAPDAAELYDPGGQRGASDRAARYAVLPLAESITQVIPPAMMMAGLCGQFRPGHFPGVATIVTKLLHIVQPDRAYFGQKDAQQLAIIRRMVADLNLPVEVVGCPIVREADGLAMSSRNRYLSPEERSQATVLYRSLKRAEQAFYHGKMMREELIGATQAELATAPAVKPQYVELVHPDTMVPLEQIEESGLLAIAAHVGSTRLIDNIVLRNRKPILAIDGPAGAGKSTVARNVAQALGLLYLDTGAMYRAVTWLVLQSGIAANDEAAIAELVSQCEIVLESDRPGNQSQTTKDPLSDEMKNQEPANASFSGSPASDAPLPALKVWINGQDVTQAIRSLEVTAHVSAIAAQPMVRRELVKQQQAYGRQGGIVMDGRDIGTHVFPDAELKIFLTASVQERARRRQQELRTQGHTDLSVADLEDAIRDRDRIDSTRQIAPLRKADDAIEIQTDNLSIDEVTAKIINLYQAKLACLESDRV